MEGLKHPQVAALQGPRFAAVEQCCYDYCQVDGYFSVEVEEREDLSLSRPNENDACLIQFCIYL